MSGWEHHCDALPIAESILLVHSVSSWQEEWPRSVICVSLLVRVYKQFIWRKPFHWIQQVSWMHFSRMVQRRGKPEVMIRDNGTNFISADKELLSGIVLHVDAESIWALTTFVLPLCIKMDEEFSSRLLVRPCCFLTIYQPMIPHLLHLLPYTGQCCWRGCWRLP